MLVRSIVKATRWMEMIIQGKTLAEIADASQHKKRKWETDAHHHRKADDLGAAVKVLKWVAFFRVWMLENRPSRLNLVVLAVPL